MCHAEVIGQYAYVVVDFLFQLNYFCFSFVFGYGNIC